MAKKTWLVFKKQIARYVVVADTREDAVEIVNQHISSDGFLPEWSETTAGTTKTPPADHEVLKAETA